MELHEARKQQQAEKERRLAEQAKFERDEFERIIQVCNEVKVRQISFKFSKIRQNLSEMLHF